MATPLKSGYFTDIGSFSVKLLQIGTDMLLIITSTVTGFLDLSTSMTLNDIEPSKRGFQWIFRNFYMQFTFQHWITTKWLEIDQDNLRMKFSVLNVNFSSPSPNPLGSRSSAQAIIKYGYPSKKWLFYHYWLVSVKTVADRHRHAAHHNK